MPMVIIQEAWDAVKELNGLNYHEGDERKLAIVQSAIDKALDREGLALRDKNLRQLEKINSMEAVLNHLGDCADVKPGDVTGVMEWAMKHTTNPLMGMPSDNGIKEFCAQCRVEDGAKITVRDAYRHYINFCSGKDFHTVPRYALLRWFRKWFPEMDTYSYRGERYLKGLVTPSGEVHQPDARG